ncbi:TIGR03067 domain-containing protein [Rhodanobacter sp. B2A1Ga4]|uniref:TIGR03067 domain-containing protein n=1 Tax=Rhodanobacter sp. B2A1Ga4 TaxID=2778647 RepID=UPI001B388E73|nr:TIGR03067 domain-containing protein [Rhodanobacter sp. B2A1Ga4]
MSQRSDDLAPGDSGLDLARLQGVWRQVRMEADGVVDPPDEHGGAGALTTIAGTHFSVRTIQGHLLLEGEFVMDASTRPKSITWIDAIGADQGKPLPGSYTLDDEHFEFIAGDAGAPRPVVFRTMSGQTMRTFVRHG